MSDMHPIHYSRPQKLVEAEEAIAAENAKARERSMSARFREIVQAAIDEGADPVDYLRDYFNDKGDHPTRAKLQEIANAHMPKINSLTDEENVKLNKQADDLLGMIAKCENKPELKAITLVVVMLARSSEDEWRFCNKAADHILALKMKISIAEAIQYVKELDS